jgi:hypothetical protein
MSFYWGGSSISVECVFDEVGSARSKMDTDPNNLIDPQHEQRVHVYMRQLRRHITKRDASRASQLEGQVGIVYADKFGTNVTPTNSALM